MNRTPHEQENTSGRPPLLPSRRRFVSIVLGGISAAIAGILGVPLLGFFGLPALRRARVEWAEAGPVDAFKLGVVKFVVIRALEPGVWPEEAPRRGAFVARKADGSFDLFYNLCTHVGCPINWNQAARRFFSPCHGGVFDPDGRVLGGPPPRPLDRYEWKVESGVLYAGRVYVVDERLERVRWHHA